MSDGCIHHWVLPSPEGAEVLGTCKKCGAQRTFNSHMEYYTFNDTLAMHMPYWPRRRELRDKSQLSDEGGS